MRLTVRASALLAWLLLCVALDRLWRLVHARNPWPRRFLAGTSRIAGVRVKLAGLPLASSTVFIANHVSWIDITALAGACGTTFVAHDGLAQVGMLRWLCELNGTVFIARHDRARVHHQVDQLRAAIAASGAVTLFPEGTTSDGTALLPFKSSLLAAVAPPPAGTSIQPVVLDYGPEAASIAWVGEEPGAANFRRILARREPVDLTIRFLAPLTEGLEDRKAIAEGARAAMIDAMPGWK